MEAPFEKMTVCRGCLATGCGMVNARRFEAVFKYVTGITISPSDGLPQSLCYECSALLRKCVRFRNKVIKSHNLLCQYLHKSIPCPYEENANPYLSRTNISFCEVPGTQAEQIDDVLDNSEMPVIIKVESVDVKEGIIFNDNEDNSAGEEYRKYKSCTVTSNHEEQIEQREIEKQAETNLKIKSGVANNGASDITGTETDIKVEFVCSEDKYNITIDESDMSVPAKHEFTTQGSNAVNTTTSEVNESEQVIVKCERTKCNSDVAGRDELHNNSEILVHCDQIDDKGKATLPHSDGRYEHVKNTINSVKCGSRDNVQSYICDTCNKCYKSKTGLIGHIIGHSGDRPYKCEVCMKSFSRKHHLSYHNQIHIGNKPHKCDVCMKGFNQRSHLITHRRIHTGVKPYKCDVCMKDFNQKHHLIAHQRIHTGEKPFKCDECKKSFKKKSHLTAHYLVHSGDKPYKCDVCLKSFNQKFKLTAHQRLHTGVKAYACDVCMKRFTESSKLIRHKRVHIGD